MKTKYILTVVILCFILQLVGCSKKEDIGLIKPDVKENLFAARIDTYPLDWEGIHKDVMPAPAPLLIFAPWASGGTGGEANINKSMLNDRKSSEGWVLLYNTFNTQTLPSALYFILYNKYRGLMRIYYYACSCNGTTVISSKSIIHGISTSGVSAALSPFLNYAAQPIVDIGRNSTNVLTTEPKEVAPNAWYAFEYEIAYDKNMHTYNYYTFDFNWLSRGMQISTISLNGTAQGSLDGHIAVDGGGVNLTGNSLTIQQKGQFVINGSSDKADNLLKNLGKAAVDGLKEAVKKGVAGIVKNVLNGIFTFEKEDNTHLKLDMDIRLTGELSSTFLIAPLRFAAPGYDQGNTSGASPAYNQPLGVFYITAKPRLIINRTSLPLDPSIPCPKSAWGEYTFSIDKSSFQYIFNPAVTSIADITNIEEELVLKRPIDTSVLITNGQEEKIGDTTVWTGLTVAEGCLTGGFFRPSDFWVRISFDVVPKDGSPKVRIVKTFIPAT